MSCVLKCSFWKSYRTICDKSTLLFENLKKTDVGEKGAALEKKKSMETEAVGKDKKKKAAGDQEASQQKKKSSETEAAEKDKELSVSLLNIQVGFIRKAWKHPSADRYANKLYFFLPKPRFIHWKTISISCNLIWLPLTLELNEFCSMTV